jgi:arylsulfatase A-like enzyme
MPEQLDAVKCVVQLRQQTVGGGAGSASTPRSDQIVDGGAMALGDPLRCRHVRAIAPLGEARALDQLIGDALKRRDDDERPLPRSVQHDADDLADAIGRRERRAAELEHLHASSGCDHRFSAAPMDADSILSGMKTLVWVLIIVVDGLRPDYVTPDLMPRLVALGQRGIVFSAHHSVFPTVTRVNASSMVTGTYPESHGLLGNTVYVGAANPVKGLDTGSRENLELIGRVDAPLLTAPSLGEMLPAAGKKLLSVGSGTSGAIFLLNHTVGTGAILHHEYTRPQSMSAHVLDLLGPSPPHATPNAAQNRRAVDAYLKIGLDDLRPDVTIMWLSDPDTTAHSKGIGSPATVESLKLVDAEIGRIEDALRAKGLLDRTNIIVASDHGFSTHTGAMKLDALVAPFAKTLPDGSRDIVVAEGSVNFRGGPDPARAAAIVAALQKRPEVGAIFTRPSRRSGAAATAEGVVPGTLSFDVARWNHRRSGDILVSANWSSDKNDAGIAGKSDDGGVAGHGTSSPYDIHNVLMAAGPGFRDHAASSVPTSTADLAPTLLRLLGLAVPASMTGRVIEEGLRSGPLPSSVRVDRVTETVSSPDGAYQLTAHISAAAGHRYLDFTEVHRK